MEPVVQLPMPIPANYNYDPRQNGTENKRARDEYERAVAVWKRRSRDSRRRIASRQTP